MVAGDRASKARSTNRVAHAGPSIGQAAPPCVHDHLPEKPRTIGSGGETATDVCSSRTTPSSTRPRRRWRSWGSRMTATRQGAPLSRRGLEELGLPYEFTVR